MATKDAQMTAMERRALDTAETILEASGLRYQSGQIPGLALILRSFAENEVRLAMRHRRVEPSA